MVAVGDGAVAVDGGYTTATPRIAGRGVVERWRWVDDGVGRGRSPIVDDDGGCRTEKAERGRWQNGGRTTVGGCRVAVNARPERERERERERLVGREVQGRVYGGEAAGAAVGGIAGWWVSRGRRVNWQLGFN